MDKNALPYKNEGAEHQLQPHQSLSACACVFPEMTDEPGFYVVDEADYETHGFTSRSISPYRGCDNSVDRPSHGVRRQKAMISRLNFACPNTEPIF